MSQDNNQVRIVFNKGEWAFIEGCVLAAKNEGWPYCDRSKEEYESDLEMYEQIFDISKECLNG